MNGKLWAAVLIGFLLGLATYFLGRDQEAQAQPEKRLRWGYKVVMSHLGLQSSADLAKTAKSLDKQYNEVAADGWQFDGVIHAQQREIDPKSTGVFVVFKRQDGPSGRKQRWDYKVVPTVLGPWQGVGQLEECAKTHSKH